MTKKALGVIALALLFSGCTAQGPEELDRLTKEDPAFKQMIVARDRSRGQIMLIKRDLLAKKRTMDAQIEKLRTDYDVYAGFQNKKIEQYRAAITANANSLTREVELLAAQCAAKEKELAEYQKSLESVKNVLKGGKGMNFSSQERKNFEERVLMLSEKIRPLAEEIGELKLQVRLKKQKTGFLN